MSAKPRDQGSKIEEYAAKPAAYNQLYSSGGRSEGEKAQSRERKSNDMIDRNLQRIMRHGTPQERLAAGQKAQERQDRPGHQQGGGIKSAEENRTRDQIAAENITKEGLALKNNGPIQPQGQVNPGTQEDADALVPKPNSGQWNTGAAAEMNKKEEAEARGNTDLDQDIVSDRYADPSDPTGKWVNMAPSATIPAASPSARQADAVNGTPAYQDPSRDAAKAKLQGFKDSADSGAKFKSDLDTWNKLPADQKKQSSVDNMMARGEQLGISPEQVNAALRGDKELSKEAVASSAAARVKEQAKPNTGSSVVANISEKYAGQGIQDGDLELAKGLTTMSPEARAKSDKEAEKIKGYKEKSDAYEKDKSDSQLAMDRFDAKMMVQESNNAKSYKDSTKAVNLVNAGRERYVSDIQKNSDDFLGLAKGVKNPIAGAALSLVDNVLKIGKTQRKDAPEPKGMDWDAFDNRDPNDPNFGQKVYQSQYDKEGNFTQSPGSPATTKAPKTGEQPETPSDPGPRPKTNRVMTDKERAQVNDWSDKKAQWDDFQQSKLPKTRAEAADRMRNKNLQPTASNTPRGYDKAITKVTETSDFLKRYAV